MDFLNINLPGLWTSKEAAEQMSSDMCTIRSAFMLREESIKEYEIILQKEKTAKCLHDTFDFIDVTKQFSVGFNYGSWNIIANFRQTHYKKESRNYERNEKRLHDPTRIFFNGINLCIDCMLKIFAKSPLPILISMHASFKTFRFLSANVSWLKLLYYPPMLKRMVTLKNQYHDYVKWLFGITLLWSINNKDQRFGSNKNKMILSDEDVIYCLVRYTLIFVMGIMKGYFDRKQLEIFWDEFIPPKHRTYYDLKYFCITFKELFTFCESVKNLQSVTKICINFFIISIEIKYADFFMYPLSDYYRAMMKNVVNDILLHHRKNTINCHYCHKYKENMKLCKGCKIIYYCSRECQKKDWCKRHRLNCKGMRKIWWTKKYKPIKYAYCSKHFDMI